MVECFLTRKTAYIFAIEPHFWKKKKTDCFLTGKIANFRSTLNHIFGKGKWLNAEEAFVTTTSPLLTCLIPLFSLYFSFSKHCGHY
jgi:hypothetical protein